MLHMESKQMVANEAALRLHSGYMQGEGRRMSTQEGKAKPELSGPQMQEITSRFGAVTVDKAKTMLFPVGILGMPDKHHFVLTDFPNPKLQQFKLLQSLDDEGLSFITLPLDMENGLLDKADIEQACRDLEIPEDQLAVVLIVSVHRSMGGTQISVNARAPIFIDTERMAAAQYVFTSNKYKVQHFITENKTADGKEPGNV